MSKLKSALFSLSASGSISGAITYLKRLKHQIVEKKPELKDAKTAAQLDWRHMFLKVVALWHALSAAEKAEWESAARPNHMTGYAWFVSQALRPNPGIYLPLQGGTMTGDINMGKHRLLKLPLPTHNQEAATKKYHDEHLPPGGYTEGARVYNDAAISIPNETETTLTFNSERYDTDAIHDTVSNTDRLTCKTAGKYIIIGQVVFAVETSGFCRSALIYVNSTLIAQVIQIPPGVYQTELEVSTIYDLAVDDYAKMTVFQSSGGALNVTSQGNKSPEFMMQRIG